MIYSEPIKRSLWRVVLCIYEVYNKIDRWVMRPRVTIVSNNDNIPEIPSESDCGG
jgi:hypothetical protein